MVKNVGSEVRLPESSLTSFLTLEKLLNLSPHLYNGDKNVFKGMLGRLNELGQCLKHCLTRTVIAGVNVISC